MLYDIEKRYSSIQKKQSMTTPDDIMVISSIICCRDKNENEMSHKEVVYMLMELCNSTTFKAADNHDNYLVQRGKLPDLKRGGHIVKAQKTSTKWRCINTAQKLQWHGLIESV
jgi:hypothetical protein